MDPSGHLGRLRVNFQCSPQIKVIKKEWRLADRPVENWGWVEGEPIGKQAWKTVSKRKGAELPGKLGLQLPNLPYFGRYCCLQGPLPWPNWSSSLAGAYPFSCFQNFTAFWNSVFAATVCPVLASEGSYSEVLYCICTAVGVCKQIFSSRLGSWSLDVSCGIAMTALGILGMLHLLVDCP